MIIKIHQVFRDLKNYRDLKKIIKKESAESPTWSKLNLRVDRLGRIYTVINLPPEVTLSKDLPKEYWPAYAIEESRPINEYLTTLNLQEILIPEYKEIKGSEAYLLIYYPYFIALSWWWIFSRIMFWVLVWFIEAKYSIFSIAWEKISQFLTIG